PGPKASAPVADSDHAELLALNERLMQSLIVEKDPAFFSGLALEQFRVLAPGGLIENKAQAIDGVRAWNAVGVKLSDTEVVIHGPVALVLGRLDIDGEMKPVGRWGPLKYMSTWVREDDQWRIFSRSLTPCLDKLVAMGRC
ncbi:MAG: nuclear transport factor 2 family protein, partial [Panacagrimonas sp.]